MDISALRDRCRDTAYSVSELNNYIKNIIEGTRTLHSVTVKGEISNFKRHSTGHLYFSLKDNDGQIRAVMFRSQTSSLRFMPENGMKVIAHGQVSVFVRDGSYQLYVGSLQPDGIGALYLAYEQMKARLSDEGLFDEVYKKQIPRFPRRIGIITSPTGAAVRDIFNVIGRRYPLADLYLYPSQVQGDGAEAQLIRGVDYFDRSGLVDVIIIGRGGGSIEDLWAFNSELLARRIFSADVPIISAVGHETDFTICDFVSDLRAPTPSAAAELAVPDIKQIAQYIDGLYDRASKAPHFVLKAMKDSLSRIVEHPVIKDAGTSFDKAKQLTAELSRRATTLVCNVVGEEKKMLAITSGKLSALNPLSVLSRGYSVAFIEKDNKKATLCSCSQVDTGEAITVLLKDGSVSAVVTGVKRSEDEI